MHHTADAPTTLPVSGAARSLQPVAAVPSLRHYIRDAWRYRDFTWSLAVADARSGHVDTVLGNVWQLLNPALLVGVYYLIFGVVFEVTRGMDNYLGFLVVGVFLFSFIRKATGSGARAVINNRSLIQSIRFPRVVLPIGNTIFELLTFLPSVAIILVVAVLTGESVEVAWLLLVPLTALMLVFNAGLAMAASRLTVHFRDLEEILPFALRLWFYMSGVLYPVDRIGDKLGGGWQTTFEANPANVYITIGRQAVLDGTTSATLWLEGVAWAVGVFAVALVFFRRHELEYGDV
jgi:teichoic acid transport system permease protein